MSERLHVIKHPLVQYKLSLVRNREIGSKEFGELLSEISMLLCYEVTRDLPLSEIFVQTPDGLAKACTIADRKIGVVPILRAGLGMVDGFVELIPTARVGHLGMYRDPATLAPVEYYRKLPADIAERDVFVLDPLLATGGSSCAAIAALKQSGCTRLSFVGIVAAPEGVKRLTSEHPDVDVYLAAIDDKLDATGHIIPGIGNPGDRLYGSTR